jgi:hypothetical protein
MNRVDRGSLVGMVLGDGHISYRTRYNKDKNGVAKYEYIDSSLIIGHSTKQYRYCEYKRNKIHSIFGGKLNKIVMVKHTLSNGKTYIGCRIQKTNKYFRYLHRKFYNKQNKKIITREVLDYLTPEGLAYWFMDDGSCSHNKNKLGKVTSIFGSISTYVSLEEAEIICEYFRDMWDIDCRKGYCKKTKSYMHRFNTNAFLKFANIIEPYLIPSMRYKIKAAEDLIKHECDALQSR